MWHVLADQIELRQVDYNTDEIEVVFPNDKAPDKLWQVNPTFGPPPTLRVHGSGTTISAPGGKHFVICHCCAEDVRDELNKTASYSEPETVTIMLESQVRVFRTVRNDQTGLEIIVEENEAQTLADLLNAANRRSKTEQPGLSLGA